MSARRVGVTSCLCFLGGSALGAQTLPAIRPIGPIVATASDSLRSVGGILQLRDGRVLVDDPTALQLLVLDASLAHKSVVLDTSSGAPRRYSRNSGAPLLPYHGDSALFLDAASLAFLVLDPAGGISRVIAIPQPSQLGELHRGGSGTCGANIDAGGRMVYCQLTRPRVVTLADGSTATVPPDSLPLTRVGLLTHHVDTLTSILMPRAYPNIWTTDSEGFRWAHPVLNPVPLSDDWTVLNDGTIAIVRARDFHIDWIDSAGHSTAGPKLPHTWIRLTDSAKAAIIDSQRRAQEKRPGTAYGHRDADGAQKTAPTTYASVDPSDLPDYPMPFQAFFGINVRADAEGRVWIPEVSSDPVAGVVYEVVDRSSVVVDRIQIPGGTSLVGFGPGVAYLTARTGSGASLVRVRIR